MKPLPEFRSGMALKAADMSALVTAIIEGRIKVSSPLTLEQTPGGVVIGWGGEAPCALVKVTSSTSDSQGFYPGSVRIIASTGSTLQDWEECKVLVP